MVSLRSPLGAGTDTVSPFLRPIRALPTGDSFERRLFIGSASVEPTMAYWNALPLSSLPATSEPTRTRFVSSSEALMTCAERSLSSSCAMRDSSMACSFLAAAYDGQVLDLLLELLEPFGGEDDVLLHASSLGKLVLECARPAHWRAERRVMVAADSGREKRCQTVDHGALARDRVGLLERGLHVLSGPQPIDVPRVELAQVARGALGPEVLDRAVDDPAPLRDDLVLRRLRVARAEHLREQPRVAQRAAGE